MTTKTFIRGKIDEDERFFIVAQTSLFPKKWNSEILNYYTVRRGKLICFSSYKDNQSPLYFTAKVKKGGKLSLYVNGALKTLEPLQINQTRNIDIGSIYSGTWYKITLGEKYSHSPVPWSFLQSYIDSKNKNSCILGNYETGYLSLTDSDKGVYPEKEINYCFLPEFFIDEKGKKHKTFDVFLKKFSERNTLRGFTLSSKDKIWYEYPRWQDTKPKGGPQKGTGIVVKPKTSRNIGTFSDLKKDSEKQKRDINSNKENGTFFKFPFQSRGGLPPTEPPNDNAFLIGFICGIIVVFIVMIIIYSIYLHFYSKRIKTPRYGQSIKNN
jgi:hypothetical protein